MDIELAEHQLGSLTESRDLAAEYLASNHLSLTSLFSPEGRYSVYEQLLEGLFIIILFSVQDAYPGRARSVSLASLIVMASSREKLRLPVPP